MTAREDGGAAFPQISEMGDIASTSAGMSLRDWFAGQALVYSMDLATEVGEDADPAKLGAYIAYNIADAMLAARAARPSDTGVSDG